MSKEGQQVARKLGTRPEFIPVLGSIVAAAVLLGLSSFFSYRDSVALAAFQHRLQAAEFARNRVLTAQLDEETGVRGYAATGSRVFLQPYYIGKAAFADDINILEAQTRRLGSASMLANVQLERALNQQWDREIALPLIRGGPQANTLALEFIGKNLVDRFRAVDAGIYSLLNQQAVLADQKFQSSLLALSLVGALGILMIVTVGGWLLTRQTATERALERQRLLYENERRLVETLQQVFIQRRLPSSQAFALHGVYIPAAREALIGGDWYDAFELPDKRILFSIGDVAGHGMEAAAIMNRSRESLLAAALREDDPAKILERANAASFMHEPLMVTAVCGFIDPETLEITYATAGHPPPVLVKENCEPFFLQHDGIPLGIQADASFRTFVAHATAGSLLVLYTDGVIEFSRDVEAGERRLLEAVSRARATSDPSVSIRNEIFGQKPPTDDVAILTIRLEGDPTAPRAELQALQINRVQIPGV